MSETSSSGKIALRGLMQRMFVFTVDEIRQGVSSPVDESRRICDYEIVGKLLPRRLDGKTLQIRDGEDLAWREYSTPTAG